MSRERHGVSSHRQLHYMFHSMFNKQKLDIKAYVTGPLWAQSTGDRCITHTKGQYCGVCVSDM